MLAQHKVQLHLALKVGSESDDARACVALRRDRKILFKRCVALDATRSHMTQRTYRATRDATQRNASTTAINFTTGEDFLESNMRELQSIIIILMQCVLQIVKKFTNCEITVSIQCIFLFILRLVYIY